MSILSYQTIKYHCEKSELIKPYNEKETFEGMSYGLGPCTYDFRVDKILTQDNELVEYYDIPACGSRGNYCLVSTIERVKLPDYICASVLDKSTLARRFVSAFNTHFDPGFEGFPTIEIVNLSGEVVTIKKGMPICQFKFEFLDKSTEKPYRGKYQNQEKKPVEYKLEG